MNLIFKLLTIKFNRKLVKSRGKIPLVFSEYTLFLPYSKDPIVPREVLIPFSLFKQYYDQLLVIPFLRPYLLTHNNDHKKVTTFRNKFQSIG